MATIPNVVCACLFLLSCVGLSHQRTVSGEERSFLMRQPRTERGGLFRPPALLANLQVREGQLQPPFSSNKFNYTVIVHKDVQDIHVTAKLALGKETDIFRVQITSSNFEADMYGSTMVLRWNASTIDVQVHVSSHKLQTSTYLLKIIPGPDDTPPASHDDSDSAGGVDGKPGDSWEALINILMIFGVAMAVSAVAVFLYGTLATLRTRRTTIPEDYQPVGGNP